MERKQREKRRRVRTSHYRYVIWWGDSSECRYLHTVVDDHEEAYDIAYNLAANLRESYTSDPGGFTQVVKIYRGRLTRHYIHKFLAK